MGQAALIHRLTFQRLEDAPRGYIDTPKEGEANGMERKIYSHCHGKVTN